jgi:hypothetical protein
MVRHLYFPVHALFFMLLLLLDLVLGMLQPAPVCAAAAA